MKAYLVENMIVSYKETTSLNERQNLTDILSVLDIHHEWEGIDVLCVYPKQAFSLTQKECEDIARKTYIPKSAVVRLVLLIESGFNTLLYENEGWIRIEIKD